MPPERSAEQFDFGRVEGRIGEAAFDAGLVTSDAGALLGLAWSSSRTLWLKPVPTCPT